MKICTKAKAALFAVGALHVAFAITNNANAASNPTQGRIQQRQAQNQTEYFRCARFALRVYQNDLSQAGNNSAKIRSARSHYAGNLGRCRALR